MTSQSDITLLNLCFLRLDYVCLLMKAHIVARSLNYNMGFYTIGNKDCVLN
jgi:hypothetical protein